MSDGFLSMSHDVTLHLAEFPLFPIYKTEQPITSIAQAGKDLALLIKLVVNGADTDTNVGMGLHQLLETIAAGNDAQNVNFVDAPLRSDERDCNRHMLAVQ